MDGALGSFTQVRLELGERLLDRVEIGAVGRKEEQRGASRFDGVARGRRLMARQVVHDDDVAGRELGHQHLADIGDERIAVDRAVEHHRGDHAGAVQAGDEGRGLPVSVGHARAQSLAAPAATVVTRHVGGRPGLVDEDQAFGIEVELAIEPLFPALQDVGAVLLGGMRRLFCA